MKRVALIVAVHTSLAMAILSLHRPANQVPPVTRVLLINQALPANQVVRSNQEL